VTPFRVAPEFRCVLAIPWRYAATHLNRGAAVASPLNELDQAGRRSFRAGFAYWFRTALCGGQATRLAAWRKVGQAAHKTIQDFKTEPLNRFGLLTAAAGVVRQRERQ
jgi:hypothetical protein